MITINKEGVTTSEAVGITEEQFKTFGDKMVDLCEKYADLVMSDAVEGLSRVDFLVELSTNFNEEELLLLALAAFEDNLQRVVQFKHSEAQKEIEVDASHIMTAEEVVTTEKEAVVDIVHEEIPVNTTTPDPIV